MFKLLGKYLGFLLITLLILSFAFWGIGDLFRGRISNVIATVGSKEITTNTYQREIARQSQQLRQAFGQISDEMLEQLGIKKMVLQQLVNDNLLSQYAEDLGIIANDEMAAKHIAAQPEFKVGGKFDPETYTRILSYQGYNEGAYIKEIKQYIATDVLLDVVEQQMPVSQTQLNTMYGWDQEKRSGLVLLFPKNYIKDIDEPSNVELIQFYDSRKADFSAPEYREVSFIRFGADSIANTVALTDDAVKQVYEEREAEFMRPETRAFEQLFFIGEDEAIAAAEAIKSGSKTFEAVAKENGQDEATTFFGTFSQYDLDSEGLLDGEGIKQLFAIESGASSDAVKSGMGWHVFRVKDITESTQLSFEEVKDALKQELVNRQIEEVLYDLTIQVEDRLGAGDNLRSVANDLSLPFASYTINREGETRSGQIVELPKFGAFTSQMFALESGETSALIPSDENTEFYVARVLSVSPARERALDEVRARVTDAWKVYEAEQRVKALAEKERIALAAEDGKPVAKAKAVASKLKIESVEKKAIAREEGPGNVTSTVLKDELFGLSGVGQVSNVFTYDANNFAVAILTDITPADPLNADALAETKEKLRDDVQSDISTQYLYYLRSTYPVDIADNL